MKNTVGHTGIYAWGDCVRHRFFQKLRSNRRTENPLPLGMGSVNDSVNGAVTRNQTSCDSPI